MNHLFVALVYMMPLWCCGPTWCRDGSPVISHLGARAALVPPAALLRPLVDGEPPTKGMAPQAEWALLDALAKTPLRQRVLRVGVAEGGGAPVALVKVQAGDSQSRLFALADAEEDALEALRVAFSLPTRLRHVDFWAVVPHVDEQGVEWHRTVFSVAAERDMFLRLLREAPKSPRELLASLSAVRYDPIFTGYAVDWACAAPTMPRTAYTAPRISEQWTALLREGERETAGIAEDNGPVRVVMGGVPNGGQVALTIDDGPHPLITPLFLEILRREKVKATFYLVGEKAEEFPGLVREIARDGHEIGNHTYSHRRFSGLSAREVYAEIRGCSKIIAALTGQPPTSVRPPGGDYTEEALKVAERLGLVTSLWTHNAGDWRRPSPTAIAYNATRDLANGDIILMHQGDLRSVEALPIILQRIRLRGLRAARLADLSHNGGTRRMSAREAVAHRASLNLTE